MSTGIEWIVNAAGCAAEQLRDLVLMRRICDEVIVDLQLNVADGPLWRKFPAPGGVTGLYLLSESHLACHTYPEHGLVTFNVYCCSERPPWPWEEGLKRELGASVVDVARVDRGREVLSKAAAQAHQSMKGVGNTRP